MATLRTNFISATIFVLGIVLAWGLSVVFDVW